MSKPNRSVTPKIVSATTPNLPPCNVLYRWRLHVGHYVTVYMDHAQPEAAWERHMHPTVQILVCGPGAECTIHWEVDHAHHQLEVRGEHVWIVGDEVLHWLDWHREAQALVFYVRPDYATEFAGAEITGSALFSMQHVIKCDASIPHLLSEFGNLDQPENTTERMHLDSLASLTVLRLFRAWSCLIQGGVIHENSLSDAVLSRLEKLIDERLDTKILLTDMAREVGMSRSNLARLFKRRMGLSLGQYLISRRINRSKELLLVDDSRIGEIALAVGFSNQGHFDAFFKKWVGLTPTDYRTFRRQKT